MPSKKNKSNVKSASKRTSRSQRSGTYVGKTSGFSDMKTFQTSRPFSRSQVVTFTTSLMGRVAAGTSNAAYIVSGNSLYKPWLASWATPFPTPVSSATATLQPCGYSNMLSSTGPYYKYAVIASKIAVEWMPGISTDTMVVAVAPTTGHNSYGTIGEIIQAPGAASRLYTAYTVQNPIVSQCATKYLYPYRALEDDDNLSGVYNAAPTEDWSWQVFWATNSNAVTTNVHYYHVTVEYQALIIGAMNTALTDTLLTQTSKKTVSDSSSDSKEEVKLVKTQEPQASVKRFVWVEQDEKSSETTSKVVDPHR